MKNMKKVGEAKKPKLIFKCPEYSISTIPLNFRIDIAKLLKPKNPNLGIDRDCYSDLDKGIEEAHAVAKMIIDKHFLIPNWVVHLRAVSRGLTQRVQL